MSKIIDKFYKHKRNIEVTRISEYQTAELSTIPGTTKVNDLFITPAVLVERASITSETANDGKPYARTVLTLSDGSMYRSAAKPVSDAFSRVPDDEFPVGPVVFEQRPSTQRGYQPFWIVRDATDEELKTLDANNKTK